MKHIYFTVTNDLTYDQRMHRICSVLAEEGFRITLVGRELSSSLPIEEKKFYQKRLTCIFNKGILFYAEYNLRLFFFLLTKKMDGICAIDLDTILPCLFISKIKLVTRIYDAHEYFTELKEVRTRPIIRKTWKAIEKFAVPEFINGYTVSGGIADGFFKEYQLHYSVIRNMPQLRPLNQKKSEKFILYQGMVNEARGFEYLLPAMKDIPYKLVICGDGNFMHQLKELIHNHQVESKVKLKGLMRPSDLFEFAQTATIGIALAEKEGLNQFMALPNKFFDYIHEGLPQIAMNYPEYQKLNSEFKVAILLDELSPEIISVTINSLMENESLLNELKSNCLIAREIYNWDKEKIKLIEFYKNIFGKA